MLSPAQPNPTQPNKPAQPAPSFSLSPRPSLLPSQPAHLPSGRPHSRQRFPLLHQKPAALSAPSTHAHASSLCHLGLARQPRHPCSVSLIARARLSVPPATSRNVRAASPPRTPAFLLGHAHPDLGRPSLKCPRPLCPPPISAAPPQTLAATASWSSERKSPLRRRVLGVPQRLHHRKLTQELRRGTRILTELSFPDPGPAAHGDSSGGASSSRLCAAAIPPLHRRFSTSMHGYHFTRG